MSSLRTICLAVSAIAVLPGAPPLTAQSADTTISRDTVYLTPVAVTATRAPNTVADLFRGQANPTAA